MSMTHFAEYSFSVLLDIQSTAFTKSAEVTAIIICTHVLSALIFINNED